jgi:hypothetical protein
VADRPVTHTKKNQYGTITHVANPGMTWSPRAEADAIRDIESGLHTYYVPWTTGRTPIYVVNGPTRKYLRTDRDQTTRNNLEDLPTL